MFYLKSSAKGGQTLKSETRDRNPLRFLLIAENQYAEYDMCLNVFDESSGVK